ncbi:MAG: hypothetical protein GX442_20210 [Candidatus Riflebacteria bacterium]|nr:hypothetical protein [Candidatus Riflebacteria bacterium]
MKTPHRLFAILLLLLGSTAGWAAEETTASTTTIPNPEMNLQVDNALPATFRGGDPDSGVVHVLEDAYYQRQEHTLLYGDNPADMGAPAGSTFEGPPTINWTTERVGDDGNLETVSNDNNNSATSGSEFPEPGEYRVGNSGARQVGSSGGGASDADGAAGTETAGSGSTGTAQDGAAGTGTGGTGTTGTAADAAAGTDTGATGTEGEAADGAAAQRVTSTQTTGVVCHDVTAPTVWAAIQEGAGAATLAESEAQLQENLRIQLLASKGQFQPNADLGENLKGTSLMAVFEFPVNAKPAEKTAALTVKGPVFNAVGKDETRAAGLAPMTVLDQELQTRQTEVGPSSQLEGVFVRRNVPFLAAAMATDNGDKCKTAAEAVVRIETKDGEPVEKTNGAYLFRVPNHPRAEFADQPEYQFVVEGVDKDGNKTVVKLPLYVVNTQVSYEGGQNE